MRYALLLTLAFFAVGCNSIQSPTASVRSANLGAVTADGLTLNLDLLVNNPNAVSLPVTRSSYALHMAGVQLLDGTADAATSIPAGGSALVMLPIRIKWEDLLKARDAIVKTGGDVPYTVNGKLNLGGGMSALLGDRASVPLSYSGTLQLKQVLSDPTTIAQSPAARELAKQLLMRLPF